MNQENCLFYLINIFIEGFSSCSFSFISRIGVSTVNLSGYGLGMIDVHWCSPFSGSGSRISPDYFCEGIKRRTVKIPICFV